MTSVPPEPGGESLGATFILGSKQDGKYLKLYQSESLPHPEKTQAKRACALLWRETWGNPDAPFLQITAQCCGSLSPGALVQIGSRPHGAGDWNSASPSQLDEFRWGPPRALSPHCVYHHTSPFCAKRSLAWGRCRPPLPKAPFPQGLGTPGLSVGVRAKPGRLLWHLGRSHACPLGFSQAHDHQSCPGREGFPQRLLPQPQPQSGAWVCPMRWLCSELHSCKHLAANISETTWFFCCFRVNWCLHQSGLTDGKEEKHYSNQRASQSLKCHIIKCSVFRKRLSLAVITAFLTESPAYFRSVSSADKRDSSGLDPIQRGLEFPPVGGKWHEQRASSKRQTAQLLGHRPVLGGPRTYPQKHWWKPGRVPLGPRLVPFLADEAGTMDPLWRQKMLTRVYTAKWHHSKMTRRGNGRALGHRGKRTLGAQGNRWAHGLGLAALRLVRDSVLHVRPGDGHVLTNEKSIKVKGAVSWKCLYMGFGLL